MWDPQDPRDDSEEASEEEREFSSEPNPDASEASRSEDRTQVAPLSRVDAQAVQLLPGRPVEQWLRLGPKRTTELPSVTTEQGQAEYERRNDTDQPDDTEVDITS